MRSARFLGIRSTSKLSAELSSNHQKQSNHSKDLQKHSKTTLNCSTKCHHELCRCLSQLMTWSTGGWGNLARHLHAQDVEKLWASLAVFPQRLTTEGTRSLVEAELKVEVGCLFGLGSKIYVLCFLSMLSSELNWWSKIYVFFWFFFSMFSSHMFWCFCCSSCISPQF